MIEVKSLTHMDLYTYLWGQRGKQQWEESIPFHSCLGIEVVVWLLRGDGVQRASAQRKEGKPVEPAE